MNRVRLTLLVAVVLVPLTGCAGLGPLRTPRWTSVERPHPGVILFICDGLGADFLETGCREGWLPNFQKRFLAAGTHVEHGTTVVPSVTYPVLTTMLTGVGPGRHQITGNRWFDPEQRVFRNYVTIPHYRDVNSDTAACTLYERIAPLDSASIQAALTRGVTANFANWAPSGVRWYFHSYTGVDSLAADTVELVACQADCRGRWPALLTCYFPALDTVGHRHGPQSPEYRAAACNLDEQIGRICDWLERQHLLETTYLILVADHGMVVAHPESAIDLVQLVRDRWGRNATGEMLQDGSRARRQRYYDQYDTVVAYQEGRIAYLYLAGARGWDERPAPEVVEQILNAPPPDQQLWNLDGIDLVAYLAGEHEAVVRSVHGTARIIERSTPDGLEYQYLPATTADPLHYSAQADLAAFVSAGFHGRRAWLAATADQGFLDVVPQLIPLLRCQRAGQAVVFASAGRSFKREAGGHGSLTRHEMRIPMIFVGPDIPAGGTIEYASILDILPTVLTLLGRPLPDDGSLEGLPLDVREPRTALLQEP